MSTSSTGRRLIGLFRPDRRLVGVSFTLAVASVSLSVVGPKLLGNATDLVFDGVRARSVDFGAVGRLLLIVLAVYVTAGALAYLQERLSTRVVQRVAHRLRADVQQKLERLPLSYVDRQSRGELLSRVTNDVDNLAQTLQQTIGQLAVSVLTVVGVVGMMAWISPVLALIALVTVPLSAVVARRVARLARPQFAAQWASTGQVNAHVEEAFAAHELVTVFGRQAEVAHDFDGHNEQLFRAAHRAQFLSGLIQPAMIFLGNLNYVLVAVVGALRVASGALTLGEVQAFIQYSRQLSQPIGQLANAANLLQSGTASAARVFELLDTAEQTPDDPAAPRPSPVTGRVELDHVSFRYSPDKPLIDDLSLTVAPGQTVAIVGPTGAGKTTLVNLLLRFYEVTGGRIMLDGVDTAAMSRADLRATTGMVLQDTWLFGGTIAQNIAYGARRPVTRDQIRAAAEATHVDHFVRTLPDGYDTVLDEEVSAVSAGERQLITIARAFLAEPAILILDEATSAVDTRTELLIQQAMRTLRQGRTSFVIAHRLTTIRDADLVLVMEDGRIVEQGTYAGLLTAGGPFARLAAAQFASSERA